MVTKHEDSRMENNTLPVVGNGMDEENTKNGVENNGLDEKQLKEVYGKVYRLTVEISPDDETTIEKTFIFKKPETASFDRYIKTASNNPMKASKAFILDNIIAEQRDEVTEYLEEYPASTIGMIEKLLEMLGMSKSVNLTLL